MKNFYIFLDIDGVMYDWKYILSLPKKGGRLDRFNPESVKALNGLISILSQNYITYLVISSTWRKDMIDTQNVLIKNGVDLSRVVLQSTPISNAPLFRGKEVLQYFNGDIQRREYVIIDDELGDFLKYFPMSRIIKTNMQDDSLNMNMVKKFLNNHDIDFSELNYEM